MAHTTNLAALRASDFGDFIWGAATAAYQIEGAAAADGKGPSVWDDFSRRKKIKRGETGDIACDHYGRMESDVDLMRALALQAYRFSISWPRVLPTGRLREGVNARGLDFYRRLAEKLLAAGVRPFATLFHWDLPLALERAGGWLNRDTASHFADYAALLTRKLGDLIKDWIVLNEPLMFTLLGYGVGYFPPGKAGWNKFLGASHHALLAQGRAARAMAAERPDLNTGTTISTLAGYAAKDTARNRAALIRHDAFFNRLYVDPVFGRGYPVQDLPALARIERWMQPGDAQEIQFPFQFLGINHYSRKIVRPAWWMPYVHFFERPTARHAERTAMGWEVHPEGLHQILKKFAAYPEIAALYITENGAAYPDHVTPDGAIHDAARTRYIQAYLAQALRAIREGVKLRGYFVWSLFDNLEWRAGYDKRFGIVHVDFNTLKRTPKDSALWYRDFIRGASDVNAAIKVGEA